MRASRYDEALAEVETHQESLGAENAMALRVLIQEKQDDVPAALSTLEAFIQSNPDSITALRLNVFVQARSGNVAAGIARARSEGDWSENDWSELAGIAISRKEYAATIIALEALTETYPEEPSYWNNLAWIRLDVGGEGSGEKAVSEADKARALDPDNPDVIDTYARALTATQRFQDVLEVAEPWSKRQAASPRWHWYLGQAQEALENRDQAVFHYREVKTLADTGLSQGIDVDEVLERLEALGAIVAP